MTLEQTETPSNADPDIIDHETRATDTDHEALRVWLRLLTCTNIVESRLRNQLRTGFDSTLPRFDLMAQLDRNPEGLKMRELSRRLMVTGGNVTGLTDKLVEEGLVERRDDPRDRRAYTVHLTPEGKRLFRQMASSHENWVIELFAGLDHDEKIQLLDLLNRLKRHLTALDSGAS
ncbi:MarR family transcriptional regulator [Azoarcus olearius]|uniref:MarR family winged helix-turn-helix transcriptional regulator n=1 Tax=Azoarcus sp. (strain BH72) TaxID=418699 RepID=UPI0008061E17|nr:MarR family transcriptional regulator [Azoarcus olearius]ANQ85189.1 MarR family transcriptional regulator [Azoarcus olearius]